MDTRGTKTAYSRAQPSTAKYSRMQPRARLRARASWKTADVKDRRIFPHFR
eukprot:CAMPEP_0185428256 /NCGR_PEP_ID=MMETSP1365-20130426/15986_1 /TAXON_ID=38817 /ORGANISM="Gephyrocapsa oceanica, Strain RCC1303" /LENGTH=50 /DNA_ID=CAMNT_0028032431 /DNA_START=149 /DNA_END=298 /DNA_ORIENTATION=-